MLLKSKGTSGLLQNHSYTILDVVETENHKLVKLRNLTGKHSLQG